ncbi:nuclear transport factor 2 family protein [Aurantiacibacter xanthus]|uniref:Nuclear transport factor 2 family protein n=1 Tax=Aurantiacibacter xanthus TaxID=1784712 RepID=A0A3A1PIF0_9SPHN|nr:nuclear transport factor 2 family protein [Aurantiacibacter xanthus]RIV93359.1 nuclear transport factor 2 family protein [Aurantiacibacter xanthus]
MSDQLNEVLAELAALRQRQAELETEVQQARDFQSVQNLQAAYGYYVDKGLWDNASELFAEDGSLELAGRGVFVGRERVREYLHHLPPYGKGMLYNHMQLQPVIHVDSAAGTAKARWRSFMMVGSLGQEARWGEATYENEYKRVDGEWKIALLHGYMNIYVEFDRGWNKEGVPLLRSIEGLQPDLPPTMQYECYPEPLIAPFHYDKV